MRYTDLDGAEVYGSDGERIGTVRDVGFEELHLPDGRRSFRLHSVECGIRLAVGHRFGYGKGDMAGPWPLSQIFSRRHRRSSVIVYWADVAQVSGNRIDLRRARRDLLAENDRT